MIILVKEFHKVFKRHISYRQDITNKQLNELRVRLLREEVTELEEALNENNRAKTLDALSDIQYILDGTYLSFGFQDVKDDAILEVHKSNMTKLGLDGQPIIRADGKIIKGPHYVVPDMQQFIKTYGNPEDSISRQ